MEIPSFGGRCVLTGAGFSANFRGFLAKEMAVKIANSDAISPATNLRALLREFDYETVLDMVENQNHQGQSEALRVAIKEVFQYQDKLMEKSIWSSEINTMGIGQMFERIMSSQEAGFLFTLNQDLWLERWLVTQPPYYRPALALLTPKTHFFQPEYMQNLSYQKWGDSLNQESLDIQIDEALNQHVNLSRHLNVVKLHGSMNWYDKKQTMMISGGQKVQQLRKWPLLTKYSEIFHDVLHHGDTRLLVIGYGFQDEHINNELISAFDKGLKLWIWGKPWTGLKDIFTDKNEKWLAEADDDGRIIYLNLPFREAFNCTYASVDPAWEKFFH